MSRDRDRILEQALKHELRAADMAATDACLDAETLGAWADDGLDGAAMVAAEAHVSSCARCQAMVAAFTRGGIPGTLAPDAPKAPSAPKAPGTLSLWRWWLAPLAAGAAAVTIWMVVPEQQQVAVAPPPRPAQADRAPAPAAQPTPSPAAPPATGARERQAPRDNLAAGAREDRQQLRDEAKQEKANAAAETFATPKENASADAPAAPAAPSVAARQAEAETPVAALEAMARRAFAPIEIPTLDPSLGWRIVGDRIERSDNGGKTWTVKRQDASDAIVAGSAPSNAVGWFVGRGGRVLLTIDSGATFTDVSLAEPLDLASIAAIDARNASIYSVAGRRFRTDDGGRTWRAF